MTKVGTKVQHLHIKPHYNTATSHISWSTCRMQHNNPAGIGNAISFGSIPLSAKTLRQTMHAIISTLWTHTSRWPQIAQNFQHKHS